MSLFKNKITIKYFDHILQKKDAENMFAAIPKSFPKYFSTIPRKMFNPESKKFIPYLGTIKTCPGFINLYKRSILVTSPFDIYIRFNDTEIVEQQAGQISNYIVGNIHSGEQLLNYVSQKKYKFIMKIHLPFYIDTSVSLHLTESSYHFNNFNILPGIYPLSYNKEFNFFIPIEKEKNEIYIKKGDPLFLLTPLCEKKIKLKFKELNEKNMPYLTFNFFKQFILNKLI